MSKSARLSERALTNVWHLEEIACCLRLAERVVFSCQNGGHFSVERSRNEGCEDSYIITEYKLTRLLGRRKTISAVRVLEEDLGKKLGEMTHLPEYTDAEGTQHKAQHWSNRQLEELGSSAAPLTYEATPAAKATKRRWWWTKLGQFLPARLFRELSLTGEAAPLREQI